MVLIADLIGNFGIYQLLLCLMIFINKVCIAFHHMAIIFLAPPVQYVCPNGNDSCCENPVYNTTIFTRTIVMEWGLICDRSWLKDFTQTLFQLGVLIGSIVFGVLSDRWGRRITLNASILLQLFTGISATFAPEYWTFTILRSLLGVSVGGIMVVGFVLLMEFVGNEKRALISALYQVPFTFGHMLLVLFGYYIRDYSYFQLATSLTTLLLLPYICFLPESPRWLLAVYKTTEAATLVEKVAKINKMPVEGILERLELYQTEHLNKRGVVKGTVLDLFRSPNMRKNIFIMSFIWFVCSYCYYGVSQYISHLSGDIFINVLISGAVTACGVLLSIPLMMYYGRKIIVIFSNVICGICLLLIAIFPEGLGSVILGCCGLASSFVVFVVAYLFCSEMFPTVVRNAAIGISSMSARVGSMVAPFIVGLEIYGRHYPPILFGILPIIAAISCNLLPETKNCELMTTLEEGENFGKEQNSVTSPIQLVNTD